VFRPLLSCSCETLTARDFQMLADGYSSQASAAFAVRSIRPVLKLAAQRGYMREDTRGCTRPSRYGAAIGS
jgi:hypothetical protein